MKKLRVRIDVLTEDGTVEDLYEKEFVLTSTGTSEASDWFEERICDVEGNMEGLNGVGDK